MTTTPTAGTIAATAATWLAQHPRNHDQSIYLRNRGDYPLLVSSLDDVDDMIDICAATAVALAAGHTITQESSHHARLILNPDGTPYTPTLQQLELLINRADMTVLAAHLLGIEHDPVLVDRLFYGVSRHETVELLNLIAVKAKLTTL